ncbi:unnamed protein product [Periconia digitata]|uniref:Uncharacterized protein n=1 Tax=Periconia digitata TaxID=1303443 RepID=A0A9W4UJ35_9PLEO|nr:unnamed protein product [Periconia digitata]
MEEAYLDPILAFADWKIRRPKVSKSLGRASRKMKRSQVKTIEPRWTPTLLGESESNCDFFKMKPLKMNARAQRIGQEIIEGLVQSDACKNFKEFANFVAELDKCTPGPSHTRLEFCVIGETGIGKSTFINAALNRPELADASDSTKACTQHATSYEYLPGAPDNASLSNVYITIVDVATRKQEAQMQIENYSKVHCRGSEGQSMNIYEQDEEAEPAEANPSITMLTEEDRNLAKHALDYFHLIWNTQNNSEAEKELQVMLQHNYISSGELLAKCIQKQEERLQDLGKNGRVDQDQNVLFTDIPDALFPGKDTLDLPAVRQLAAMIWPLIHKVTIRTGGVLLRNGIVLTDLPGYGDLNMGRIAITNNFRLEADYEIIIAEGLRIEDSKTVYSQITSSIHAHGLERTLLVVNKMDVSRSSGLDFLNLELHTNGIRQQNFRVSDEEVDNLIERKERAPFNEISQRLDELESISDLDDADADAYEEYLRAYTRATAQRSKINDLKIKM